MFGMVMLRSKFALAQCAWRSQQHQRKPAGVAFIAGALVELAARTTDEVQRGSDLSEAEKS
jgi:hypothetical protein